jgi:hypothetical protein
MLSMKSIFSIALFMIFAFAGNAQTAVPATAPKSTNGPKMVFEKTDVDYGEIKKGSDRVRKATFVNKGTEPLIIKNARGSCGCTVPTWPKEPIMPGESGVIEINYDTQRVGPINKTVTIQTNEGDEEQKLYIKGNISPDEEETLPKSNGNIISPKPN